MSNAKMKYTEKEWDELEKEALAMAANDEAKEQAFKDMQIKSVEVTQKGNHYEYTIKIEEDE